MNDNNNYDLALIDWASWCNASGPVESWSSVLEAREPITSDARADVDFLPPASRRRLKPLSRAVLHVAERALGGRSWDDTPVILFSTHGESFRSLRIVNDIASHEHVSPADFSYSVHNAIGGQLSILTSNCNPVISLADSGEGICSALLEASLLLEAGDYEQVMIICYDEPLPEFYARYTDNPLALVAFAALLGNGDSSRRIRATRELSNEPGETGWRQMIHLAQCLDTRGHVSLRNEGNVWELDVVDL